MAKLCYLSDPLVEVRVVKALIQQLLGLVEVTRAVSDCVRSRVERILVHFVLAAIAAVSLVARLGKECQLGSGYARCWRCEPLTTASAKRRRSGLLLLELLQESVRLACGDFFAQVGVIRATQAHIVVVGCLGVLLHTLRLIGEFDGWAPGSFCSDRAIGSQDNVGHAHAQL